MRNMVKLLWSLRIHKHVNLESSVVWEQCANTVNGYKEPSLVSTQNAVSNIGTGISREEITETNRSGSVGILGCSD